MKTPAIPFLALSAALALAAMPSLPAGAQLAGFGGPSTTRPNDPKTVEQADRALDDLRRQIESYIDRPYFGSDSVRAPLIALADQRDKATLTLASRKAREEAVQKKIDELTQEGRALLDQDPTLAQLQKVAAAKQADAERTQALVRTQTVASAEVEAAIAAAAEAQVRIQERREAIMASVGGGVLAALNKELIAASLDVSEQAALLKFLDERMARFGEAERMNREYMRLESVKAALTRP